MRFICAGLILLLSTLGSCKKDADNRGIMSKEQMADWMMDIYLAEGRISQIPINRDSAHKIFLPYQDSLMNTKGIQDSLLKKSYEYYLAHPVEFEEVYDIIID